jgi:hypothetical protein
MATEKNDQINRIRNDPLKVRAILAAIALILAGGGFIALAAWQLLNSDGNLAFAVVIASLPCGIIAIGLGLFGLSENL